MNEIFTKILKLTQGRPSEFISKILINFLLISILITIFFFTYVIQIEKMIIIDQMNNLCKNLSETTSLFGTTLNGIIKENINKFIVSDMEDEDKRVLESNNKIIWNVVKLVSIAFVIITVIISFIYFGINYNTPNKYSMKNILIESLAVLVFIGLTEYVFLTYFGAKYNTLDPNVVKKEIFKSIKKYDSN
jgi:hypothetical protein